MESYIVVRGLVLREWLDWGGLAATKAKATPPSRTTYPSSLISYTHPELSRRRGVGTSFFSR
jgi:hypothetical protein